MIDVYFRHLEQLLQQFPTIQSSTLTRKVYNATQGFITGSILFENGCRLDFIEVKDIDVQAKIKYRYQYMDSYQELVFRYDNAPHHQQLKTFPHHKHLPYPYGEQESEEPSLEDVLLEIAQYERREHPYERRVRGQN
ncbi:hypothetical protein GF339_17285 [candidate division KSB3 bacterium]|uniref:Uncharacterized protein n=1 Tax=candidate division KSB3 bacterium TaxID=2044937 RepID=A0A9D5JXX4_9BACT|nr:hypothetical protein [candidate division KSB3 bacterium]MBD3326342.1 hypothetical protein [candidate division KSB3 bacterium]